MGEIMYWQKKRLSYDILIPPIQKPFEEFNLSETETYFKWYISQICNRIKYLQNYSDITLNYSVDSLVDIWGWFLRTAEIEKTSKSKMNEVRRQLKGQPKEIAEVVLKEQSEQFTLETEYIIRDIAMYFGEVYIKNNSAISWGYHTDVKADSFANMPLLVGFEDRDFDPPFKANFEPVEMLHIQACNIFDNSQSDKDLLNLYNTWKRMVYN